MRSFVKLALFTPVALLIACGGAGSDGGSAQGAGDDAQQAAAPAASVNGAQPANVAGDRDGFTPSHLSETMAARIRGSELMMVPGGSHTAPIERPTEVTGRILDFLRTCVDPKA